MKIENGILKEVEILGVPVFVDIVEFKTRKHRPGTKSRKNCTVYHETGNFNRGADARAHSRLLKRWESNPTEDQTSWHFVVDDKEIIQNIPLDEVAYCQGTRDGNMLGISIEQCVNDESVRLKAEENACKLHAALIHTLGLKLTKHQDWNGKRCPYTILSQGRWGEIERKIEAYSRVIIKNETVVQSIEPYSYSILTVHGDSLKFGSQLSKRLRIPMLSWDTPFDYSGYGRVIGVGDKVNISSFTSYLTHFINGKDDWSTARNNSFIEAAVKGMGRFMI